VREDVVTVRTPDDVDAGSITPEQIREIMGGCMSGSPLMEDCLRALEIDTDCTEDDVATSIDRLVEHWNRTRTKREERR